MTFRTRQVWLPLAIAWPIVLLAAEPTERQANRLARETSPYLLLHAHNPVDWYPWGRKAFDKAKRENKLIFLSIGYSSCYWCHVMERESFMDEEIAEFLNQHFVSIKVDREERPDVDDLYMTSLQIYFQVIGSPQGGGWPLSMFLTPEGAPIFGGTYFPPQRKLGRAGFLDVLNYIHRIWNTEPEKLRVDSQQLVRAVTSHMQSEPVAEPSLDPNLIGHCVDALAGQFDANYGGFGFSATNPQRPKFPEPANLMLLLELAREGNQSRVRKMLTSSLDKMAQGGVWDHLGGGFHRYSTDRYWHVPHFEKMLYDNGQLATVYSEAFALTGDTRYERTVRHLLDFVLREMTDEAGGFYSAIDAETDAEEGKFYAWSDDQLDGALNEDQRQLLDAVYGTGGSPVFEHKHVLLLREPLAVIAKHRGVTTSQLRDQLEPIHDLLLAVRNQRKRPLLDTKVLTAWNGLMIRGFADAGRVFNEPTYISAASRAAQFVISKLQTEDGRLLRTYSAGVAKLNGYLDDYAFLVDGLLALYRATGEQSWLDRALALTDTQLELFWDDRRGGFFFTSHDHEELFVRVKKLADGAIPAGNSVAAENLLRLAALHESSVYRKRARATIAAAVPLLKRAPSAAPRMIIALSRYENTPGER